MRGASLAPRQGALLPRLALVSCLALVAWGCGSEAGDPQLQPAAPASSSAGLGGTGAPGLGAPAGASGSGRGGSPASSASAGVAAPPMAAAGSAAGTAAGAGGAGAPVDEDAGQDDAAAGSRAGSPSFSDSFEQGAQLDAARYEVVMPNCSGTGSAAIDDGAGHTGSRSLRIMGGAGYCNHVFVRPRAPGDALGATTYARVFVKLMAPLGANHTTFMAMHDAREDKDLRLGGQNQVLVWNRESDDATLPELSPTGVGLSAPLAADRWQCLEWLVDGARGELRVWLDGQAIAGLTLDAEPTPDVDRQWQRKADWRPQPTDLRLGWESYSDQANVLWFDDLALSASRIGCTP